MRRLALLLIACPMLAFAFGPLVRNMMLEIASRRDDVGPNTEGLLLYYSMRESGGTVFDEFGDNDGSTFGDPPFDPVYGVRNDGVDLDGVDQYIDAGMADVHVGNSFSVCAWIWYESWASSASSQPGSSHYRSFFSKGSIFGTEGREITFSFRSTTYDDDGVGQIDFRTSLGAVSVNAYATHPGPQWLHVVGVWEDGDQRLYLDGEEVATGTLEGTPVTNDSTVKIGSPSSQTSSDRRYIGHIDEVLFYERGISAAEVTAEYERNKAGAGH